MVVLENRGRAAELKTIGGAVALVSPPSDDEVYCYMGWQLRAVPVLLIVAYGLAAWSLVKFTLAGLALLWPMFIVLGLNALGTVLSTLTSFNNRRVSAKRHRRLVGSWAPAGPAPSVDVFLPTMGEDLAVLANTYTYVGRMEWTGTVAVRFSLRRAAQPRLHEEGRQPAVRVHQNLWGPHRDPRRRLLPALRFPGASDALHG
jgi:cellulose synthase (UDP-forming)